MVPPEVVDFMRLPGLGPKTAARIWRQLGVTTIEELKAAAEQQQLRTLAGLGAKTEERVLKALADAAAPRIPRHEVTSPLLGGERMEDRQDVGVLPD
jgi:DNA polymerase/3'-5' exonuclease PolX